MKKKKKRICHIYIFHYCFAFKLGQEGNVQVFLLVKHGDLIPWSISTFVFRENHSTGDYYRTQNYPGSLTVNLCLDITCRGIFCILELREDKEEAENK